MFQDIFQPTSQNNFLKQKVSTPGTADSLFTSPPAVDFLKNEGEKLSNKHLDQGTLFSIFQRRFGYSFIQLCQIDYWMLARSYGSLIEFNSRGISNFLLEQLNRNRNNFNNINQKKNYSLWYFYTFIFTNIFLYFQNMYIYFQLSFVQQIPDLSIQHPGFVINMPTLPKSKSRYSISIFSVCSTKSSYMSYHSLMYILMVFLLMSTCMCYDTKIPLQKIHDEKTITTIQNINYLQQSNNSQWLSNNLQDNIVRVRLGKNNAQIVNKMNPLYGYGNAFQVTNQNIFDWSVHQLQDTNNNGGASSANSICDVVKVIQYNGNYDKYLLNYNINNNNLNTNIDQDQKFISTVHVTQSTTYSGISTNPQNKRKITNDIKQTQQKITIYSLTNNYNIHKITINTKQVMIAKQQSSLLNQQYLQQSNNKFINKNKKTQQTIYKIKGINHQKCKDAQIQLFMMNTHVVISCVRQGQLAIFPIQFVDRQWQMLHDKGIILSTDGNVQIKQNQHANDHDIYIMTQSHIYRVSNSFTDKPDNIKLTYKQLNLKQFTGTPSFITFTITNSQSSPYLLLIQQKNGLLLYNVHTNTIQFKDNFQNKFNMADVQLLTYTTKSNIKQNNTIHGVLQIVVLVDDRKQFIVQIFHQWNTQNHKLHINKIYHSYNANTNQAYIQQQQNSLNNIHYIQQILQPTTNTGIHNNIGILKLQHRLIFFHYGIPRTISPSFSSSSQFIRQQTYTNIVNIRDAHAQKTIKQKKIYNQQWIRSQIDAAWKTGRMLVDMNNLVKYIVTLDKYIHVIQIDPRNMYHHDYVCNLNSIGVITQQHKLLNDVKIYLQTLCNVDQKKEKYNNEQQDQNNTKHLGYCQVQQTIKFNVNFDSLQNQRDLKRHVGFIVLVVILSILLAIVVAILLHNIRKQAEKLSILRKQRKRVMENSVIERTEVSQVNSFISQLSYKGGKQFVIP